MATLSPAEIAGQVTSPPARPQPEAGGMSIRFWDFLFCVSLDLSRHFVGGDCGRLLSQLSPQHETQQIQVASFCSYLQRIYELIENAQTKPVAGGLASCATEAFLPAVTMQYNKSFSVW